MPNVAVLGAGTMGAGIAQVAATSISPDVLSRAAVPLSSGASGSFRNREAWVLGAPFHGPTPASVTQPP